ncbi:MAG: GNAT family N-acetyltransferase [Candidatus Izemoplasmatales bacterium]|jgi:GNAT superfamily N-acetyltransferase|nr:GNAT family N-acetyltransferase [Candidatus Izemoplasmatales bacterium]
MILRPTKEDLTEITLLARIVAKNIRDLGIDQWSDTYPNYSNFEYDLEHDGLFVIKQDNKIIGSVSLLKESDPFYKELVWKKDHSLVIHRLMVHPDYMRQKLGMKFFDYAIQKAKNEGYLSIKVDTHPDNFRMQNLIKTMGFVEIGFMIQMHRIGYELVLS